MRVMIAVGVSMGGTRWTKCVSCGGRVRHALAAKVCFYTNGLSCGGGEAFHMRHSPVIPRGSHALHGSRSDERLAKADHLETKTNNKRKQF